MNVHTATVTGHDDGPLPVAGSGSRRWGGQPRNRATLSADVSAALVKTS